MLFDVELLLDDEMDIGGAVRLSLTLLTRLGFCGETFFFLGPAIFRATVRARCRPFENPRYSRPGFEEK